MQQAPILTGGLSMDQMRIKWVQFYHTLICALSCKNVNQGNLKHLACQVKVASPFSLSKAVAAMKLWER